jgi:hypothetical protein
MYWEIWIKVSIILNGMDDGPYARIIGASGNNDFKVVYGPMAYIEYVNKPLYTITSLYKY